MNESNILLYETDEGNINVDVVLKDENIWLTQKSMAELFECSSDNIGLHLKNIFLEEELNKLKRLTVSFLDYAEDMAEEHQVMTMNDWINITDKLLLFREKNVLRDSGKISHKKAIEKAEEEYEKFRIKQDQEYISSMDEMYKKYLEENNK